MNRMLQQTRHASDNGKTQTQAERAIACRIVQLIEFFKDRFQLIFRNPGSGVENLNPHPGTGASTPDQDLSVI